MARRKPLTHAQEERRRRRQVTIFGIIMILLMVLSPIAYYAISNPGSGNQLVYGDYAFALEDRPNGGSVLVTDIDGQEVEFQNLPVQVGYLEMDPAITTVLRSAQQVALVADPALSIQDASLVDYARLQLGIAIPKSVNGMLEEDARYALPVLGCAQASQAMPVVILNVTNGTAHAAMDGYCIMFEGDGRELLKLKDRLIFEYYGIEASP